MSKTARGGPGRGQGRKPLKQGEETVTLSLRVTKPQREKLASLGGAGWVRGKIDGEKGGQATEAGNCRRCGGKMLLGQAIAQTFDGVPDFPGCEVVTISPGGPGRLVDCQKCRACGHSVTG